MAEQGAVIPEEKTWLQNFQLWPHGFVLMGLVLAVGYVVARTLVKDFSLVTWLGVANPRMIRVGAGLEKGVVE